MEGTPLALSRATYEDFGIFLVAVSVGVALVTAFVLRTRAPAPLSIALLAAAGAGLGWGGMLIRLSPPLGEVVTAIVLLAVLVPAHVRIVLGPLGRGSSARGPQRSAG